MSKALAVTDETFEAEVLNSDIPVFVDFWATWCPPCRMMGPIVDELAEELEGKVKVVKLDIDQARKTAVKYGVVSVPTFNLFIDGDIVANLVGAHPKKTLLEGINKFL